MSKSPPVQNSRLCKLSAIADRQTGAVELNYSGLCPPLLPCVCSFHYPTLFYCLFAFWLVAWCRGDLFQLILFKCFYPAFFLGILCTRVFTCWFFYYSYDYIFVRAFKIFKNFVLLFYAKWCLRLFVKLYSIHLAISLNNYCRLLLLLEVEIFSIEFSLSLTVPWNLTFPRNIFSQTLFKHSLSSSSYGNIILALVKRRVVAQTARGVASVTGAC